MTMLHEALIHGLAAIVGTEHVSTNPEQLVEYSQDALKQVFRAEAIVFPGTAEEIAAIMRFANEHRVYVTVRGGGVGYTGGAVPLRGGIVMATDRLNRILAKHTGQPIEQIDRDTDRDRFMSGTEGVEYGLIDSVLESRTDVRIPA